MKEKLTEWLQCDSRAAWLLLALGIAGMVLISLGGKESEHPVSAPGETYSWEEYRIDLENRLEEMIGQIQGAGKAAVMITLETGEETVYALDIRQGNQTMEKEHILLDKDGALVETVWYPTVQGVAIVCQGADDVRVRAQIIETAQVLTGVTTNRISIAKMN